MRKMVKARARHYAHMAVKMREWRQFNAALVWYGKLLGVCSALAEWGAHDAHYWFRWMLDQEVEMSKGVMA